MMHHDDINEELKELAFNFFYFFSRFEFALKENRHIYTGQRNVAHADWKSFIEKFEKTYEPCVAAKAILSKPPDIQFTENGNAWDWQPLTFDKGQSELSRTVLAIKTVRNNLFHGGKHSAAGWDDPDRIRFLLQHGHQVLNSFAKLANFKGDYERCY